MPAKPHVDNQNGEPKITSGRRGAHAIAIVRQAFLESEIAVPNAYAQPPMKIRPDPFQYSKKPENLIAQLT